MEGVLGKVLEQVWRMRNPTYFSSMGCLGTIKGQRFVGKFLNSWIWGPGMEGKWESGDIENVCRPTGNFDWEDKTGNRFREGFAAVNQTKKQKGGAI